MGYGYNRRDGVICVVSVKMKTAQVLRCDFVELADGGIGDDIVAVSLENLPDGLATVQLLMAVSQTLYDPAGLDVDKDYFVVRAEAGRQHTHHRHFQGVNTGKIEDAFW